MMVIVIIAWSSSSSPYLSWSCSGITVRPWGASRHFPRWVQTISEGPQWCWGAISILFLGEYEGIEDHDDDDDDDDSKEEKDGKPSATSTFSCYIQFVQHIQYQQKQQEATHLICFILKSSPLLSFQRQIIFCPGSTAGFQPDLGPEQREVETELFLKIFLW